VSRIDILKSLLNSGVNTVRSQLQKIKLPENYKRALEEAIARNTRVTEQQLTHAVGSTPGIIEVTISIKPDRIGIDAHLEEDQPVQASLIPARVVFAPQGAKEVSFRVDPIQATEQIYRHEFVSAICCEIARAAWGPFLLPYRKPSQWGFVERENNILRVDLRTIPEVRSALNQRFSALAIELFEIKQILLEEGALKLKMSLGPALE